jgi:hypothetical protein
VILKLRASTFAIGVLLCTLFAHLESLSAQAADTWSFAVSGDSRNCGDIVMPGIAAGVRTDGARFYWHLGDFRATYDFDQDMLAAPEYRDKHLAIADYLRIEWQDFISQQVDPFGDIPVYLGIGNHELVSPKTRADYLEQSLIGLTLQRFGLRDFVTIRTITNSERIITGFKVG